MVIQRIQSVFLLLAAALMGGLPWVPFGEAFYEGQPLLLSGTNYPVVMIISLVAALLFLIDIFLFKSFKLQKTVLGIALLLTAVSAGLMAYFNIAAVTNGYEVSWSGGCFMAVGAFILGMMAQNRIRHDEQLLRSYDRIR